MRMHDLPFSRLATLLQSHDSFVLLETLKRDADNARSHLFLHPTEIIHPADLAATTAIMEENADKRFVAGAIHYDGSAELGIFEKPIMFDHASGTFDDPSLNIDALKPYAFQDSTVQGLQIGSTEAGYRRSFDAAVRKLRAGESYQVNLTVPCTFEVPCDPLSLYERLRRSQRVAYAALIRFNDRWILSLSPELFFRRDGRTITVKPMKGTAQRGRTNAEDQERTRMLQTSTKERAENTMIVDLLRSDLGKISTIGSVEVAELCAVEKIETVLQMTSTIESRLRPDVGWREIFLALFPSGSVTGAPKIRTMEIIRELEREHRGVSYGVIGFAGPESRGVFSVAIRTMEVQFQPISKNAQTQTALAVTTKKSTQQNESCNNGEAHLQGVLRVGGGITVLSDPRAEWRELNLKAQFLTIDRKPFKLIETLRLEQGSYLFFEEHLERLQESAEYFGFVYDRASIAQKLLKTGLRLRGEHDHRVRLLLDRHGDVTLSSERIDQAFGGHKLIANSYKPSGSIKLSSKHTGSSNPFLYHKTTNRDLYDREYAKAKNDGYLDIIFQNEHGELTEGAITNLFVRIGGKLYTPPVSCGLLNGVLRRGLIAEWSVAEKILYPDDLASAGEIFVGNSVRGLSRVEISVQ